MWSKIILGGILAAAFLYALWLVLSGRPGRSPPLRDGRAEPGLSARVRWLFAFAVLLVVAGLQADSERGSYGFGDEQAEAKPEAFTTLQLAWQILNTQPLLPDKAPSKQGMQEAVTNFRAAMDRAVREGLVPPAAAAQVVRVHRELAYHLWRYNYATCYESVSLAESTRAGLCAQLVLLSEAREKGLVTDETVDKVARAIQKEVEVLRLVQENQGADAAKKEIWEGYELPQGVRAEIHEGRFPISPISQETTALILQLENDAPQPEFPQFQSRSEMKSTPFFE